MSKLNPRYEVRCTAAVDMVGRTGAKDITFGYEKEDVPVEEAEWWASATWPANDYRTEGHRGPAEALEALVFQVCEGGGCVHCGRPVSLIRAGDEGICFLERVGLRYVRGCSDEFPDGRPVTSKRRLAEALVKAGAPKEMALAAIGGFYSDYESPVADNIHQLVRDARALGLEDIAQRAIAGEFDGTREESDAWAQSPEGREVFAELTKGAGPNRAARRAAAKKKGRQ